MADRRAVPETPDVTPSLCEFPEVGQFRFALEDFIATKIEYDKAREAFGSGYDWDYYGSSDIARLERATKRLDEAFVAAVRGVKATSE